MEIGFLYKSKRFEYNSCRWLIKTIEEFDKSDIVENDNPWAVTIYEYNENNRITEIRNALGEIVKRNKYNSEGQILEIKDGTGHGVSYVYDIGGRVSYLKTPKGEKYNKNTQSYSYDPWGNITSIIDAQGRNTKYDLDSWGRVTQILKPDNTRETYSYDHIGNIVETKDSNGNKIEYI